MDFQLAISMGNFGDAWNCATEVRFVYPLCSLSLSLVRLLAASTAFSRASACARPLHSGIQAM
eukprot:7316419-Alexandrium_andersonii.AAC.1